MSRRELDESTAISIVPNKDAEIAGSVIGKLTTVEALETGKVSAASFAHELFFLREQRMVGGILKSFGEGEDGGFNFFFNLFFHLFFASSNKFLSFYFFFFVNSLLLLL